jgi:hypothetical protein
MWSASYKCEGFQSSLTPRDYKRWNEPRTEVGGYLKRQVLKRRILVHWKELNILHCSKHAILSIFKRFCPLKNGVFWMLRRTALVITDVAEELSASFIRVTRISELGTTLAVTSNQRTLRRNWSILTSATRRNVPEDTILHSHRRENLKSYIALTG